MKSLINFKKLINIRNLIIVALCITIIFLGIGFSILSVKLKEKSEDNLIFDVAITKVVQNTSIKGDIYSPTATHELSNHDKTITTKLSLYAPFDEVSYTLTVENRGTITAEILDIIESPNYTTDTTNMLNISPVEITYYDVVGTILEPNETTEIKVVASYKPAITIVPRHFTYSLTILTESKAKEE